MLTVVYRFSVLALFFCFSCCASVKERAEQEDATILKDLQTLSSDDFEGRKTGTTGAERARAFITERFKSLGIQTLPDQSGYLQSFQFNDKKEAVREGINVLGYIPGKLKETLVISAHYDHLGRIKDSIYNGADDNASGVAALLHFAAYFSKNKPNFTLIFAAFDAEEMGLQGAKAFVANPPVPLERIKLNINMDMIAHNDKNELYVCGANLYPQMKNYIEQKADSTKIKLLLGHDDPKAGHDDWTNQSDQGAFHAKGIPFLYFGVEDHRDYHQPSDTYENTNPTFYVGAVDAILNVLLNIDNKLSSHIQIDKNKIM
ncbi:M28 family peptidase [Olivibacter sp. XZL3]|uniref:M28 family peptidase n=1 Tax=Olivibacter sp. XZL3 TaxID=1735116 RepID=UPI001064A581|nr:M28 family peptidase [Olivibacter sp. XZL3]